MFASLLIANRGEIACRVIATARRMGLRTIAVYSAADAGARHVALADEAHEIGPPPARESYLDITRIIAAARASGAEAIHPGYGFLSENADFAAACGGSGIVFVGPPVAAMRAMGDKAQAKALMEAAGVPVVPGYHGVAQDEARFVAEAQRIGFPVLVKASAGGGGRGMRVVAAAGELPQALESARREAQSAFGDGRLILEKYLGHPRHIEVQIFADRGGNAVHLFERDCSVQRRHQKVIEEAPSVLLSDAQRRSLGATALAAARAVGYVGAGTVEFIVEGGAFHFIEMNTRLQVEHPVTEMITGTDLVEWQLRVAAGESLPLAQDGIVCRGHAIEARLYAEDPRRDFLPASGTLARFDLAAADATLRIETGVRAGEQVGVYYDALLGKLVAWGEDRATALRRLAEALKETRVAGVATNRDLLLRIVQHADFAAGDFDTGFIARHRAALVGENGASFAALAAAALALAEADAPASVGDPHSPWLIRDGWRHFGVAAREMRLRDHVAEHVVRLRALATGTWTLDIDGKSTVARHVADEAIVLDGARLAAAVSRHGMELTVMLPEETCRLVLRDPYAPEAEAEAGVGRLTAPLQGKVLAVLVEPGTAVTRGQLLMLLEAMKMEHAIAAPCDGVVTAVHFAAGDLVEEGALLLDLAAGADQAKG